MHWPKFSPVVLLLCCAAVSVLDGVARAKTPAGAPSKSTPVRFESDVQPLLARYCYDCHGEKKKGGLDMRLYRNAATAKQDPAVFEKVRQHLVAHEMPPEGKPQPTPAERDVISHWIESEVLAGDPSRPDPGRVTIRRLNRAEYSNTIRDLVGVEFRAGDDFPADDVGYGFDNIGDVLSLSPVLFEKYLTAAEKILDAAIIIGPSTNGPANRICLVQPADGNQREAARQIIQKFATRAYRRPVAADELNRLMQLFDSTEGQGVNFESRLKVVLQAVLISPHFLFRGELQPDPDNPASVHRIDEYALASRLSYFLWSSMPDDELFALAEKGQLQKSLPAQVKRMMRDPKSLAFVENFAGQWLQLRNLKLAAPDPKMFPGFDEELRDAMGRETELFFANVMREDRSVLDFLDANYTFVNERLARHYGFTGVTGSEFRKVNLKSGRHGGLLTQASILTITSNPTRTSPVKRGKWVLENILGTPPPPPPPEVPVLKDSQEARQSESLRQRMVQHREDPNCSVCHARMDPIGFAFENYDAIGAWRDRDSNFPVDASGRLDSGESFKGADELKRILLKRKRDDFERCLAAKMLTYALGRGLEPYDKFALDGIVKRMQHDGDRFSGLIQGVTQSTPFQMRRGEGPSRAAELKESETRFVSQTK